MFQVFVVKILHTVHFLLPQCILDVSSISYSCMWLWFTELGRAVWTKRQVFLSGKVAAITFGVRVAVRVSGSLYLIFRRWLISDVNCVIPLLLLTLVLYVQSPQLGKLPGAWSLTTREHHMLFAFAGTATRYRLIGTWSRGVGSQVTLLNA